MCCDSIATRNKMKTLVLGLGNPLLGDDGVGWRVAEACATHLRRLRSEAKGQGASHIEVDFHAGGGLSLMERLVGYDRAIIIDAMTTNQKPQGSVSCFRLEDLPYVAASHLASAHETTLQTALQVGRTLNAALPSEIIIVAVETQAAYDFNEELSPVVASAVRQAFQFVQSHLIPKEGAKV